MSRFKIWWSGRTLNEKLMYSLVVVLIIGIVTRWGYVTKEISEGFSQYFNAFSKE